MIKKYLFISKEINRFGCVPRSKQFSRARIKAHGKLCKGEIDYCYIEFDSGEIELTRYDEKGKRWSILCFPNKEVV